MLHITITLAMVIALASGPRGTEAAQQCPLYWTKFQNHCYRAFYYSDGTLSQREAEAKCNEFSSCSGSLAHLPSASTPAEYDFLRVWLGGIIPDFNSEPVRIGLWSDENDEFFGYDYTKIKEYPYIDPPSGYATYVLFNTGLQQYNTGVSFYVCKMHTKANNNFKDLYFDTTTPLLPP